MKFIAILKDSFREAVDAKVFYVMIALSTALILFACCLTFKPAPNSAEEFYHESALITAGIDLNDVNMREVRKQGRRGAEDIPSEAEAKKMLKKSENAGVPRILSFEQYDAKNLNSPDSTYRLVIGVRYFSAARADQFRENPAEAERMMKEQFGRFGDIQVCEAKKVTYLPAGDPKLEALLANKVYQDTEDVPFAECTASGIGHPDPQTEIFFELEVGPSSKTRLMWKHELFIFGQKMPFPGAMGRPVPLGLWILFLESKIVNGLGAWVTLVISIVITSFFIPNMLRKGTVDLLIVKPINRWSLLLMKYLGGMTFVFLNTSFAIIGSWIALSLKTGVWAPGFLISIPIMTFFFAILYAFSTLFAVLTRSVIACIMLTTLIWLVVFVVGVSHQIAEEIRMAETLEAENKGKPVEEPGVITQTIGFLHMVLPRTRDLDVLADIQLQRELLPTYGEVDKRLEEEYTQISWGQSLSVSAVYIALILALSCWLFSIKDY